MSFTSADKLEARRRKSEDLGWLEREVVEYLKMCDGASATAVAWNFRERKMMTNYEMTVLLEQWKTVKFDSERGLYVAL